MRDIILEGLDLIIRMPRSVFSTTYVDGPPYRVPTPDGGSALLETPDHLHHKALVGVFAENGLYFAHCDANDVYCAIFQWEDGAYHEVHPEVFYDWAESCHLLDKLSQ